MKSMTVEQRKAYVKQKSTERSNIQAEILTLSEKRKQYIAQQSVTQNDDASLDAAMLKAIKEKGKTKNLSWQ
jgi:hypothetical protein